MLKKKRLVLGAAILLALWGGMQYGFWLTVFCIVLLVALLGALKGIRYSLAHLGVRQLTKNCARRHLPRRIEALKASEKPGAPFTFVVLGDNRNAVKIPRMIHQKVKAEEPGFLFNTGDLVRFGTAREFVSRYLPLLEIMDPIPVFSIPGNHDRGARSDFAAFRAVHGEERFSFDYGPCRFVGVNNAKRARLTVDDLEFLEAELGKSPQAYKFVFIHIPPRYFEDGLVIVEKRRGFKKLQQEFHALMARRQVTEVFMGHIHGYASREIDGVRYTLTAGAGAPLGRQLPVEARVYNYVVLYVDAEGLKREVVRCVNGEWVRNDAARLGRDQRTGDYGFRVQGSGSEEE
jgi:Icc-related predicted phosphoesterase